MALARTLAVCAVLMLAAPRLEAAEWHFTPTLGVTFGGTTTFIDLQHGTDKRHLNFGGMVSRFGDGVIGAEGVFVYTRHFFEFDGRRDPADPVPPQIASSSTMSLTGNLVLTVPKRWTEYFLRPYASGGFGVIRAVSVDQPNAALQPGAFFPLHANMPAFSVGGGAIGFFSQNTGIRFDVRYHAGLHADPAAYAGNLIAPDVHLRYMTAQIGVVIRR